MITFFKRVTVIGAIIFGWIILMVLMIEEELGATLFSINNQIHTISGTNISYSFELHRCFTNFLGQVKQNSNLQIIVLILGVILIQEMIFKLLAVKKS